MIGEIPCACPDCNFKLRMMEKKLSTAEARVEVLEGALMEIKSGTRPRGYITTPPRYIAEDALEKSRGMK